jgi:hypothetical protein
MVRLIFRRGSALAPAGFPKGEPMAKKKTPATHPDEFHKVEVLPGILIETMLHPEHDESEFKNVHWPVALSCPPSVGHFIFSNCGQYVARIVDVGHRLRGDVGPICVVVMRVEERER